MPYRYCTILIAVWLVVSAVQARDTPLPPVVTAELRQQNIPASSLSVYAEDLSTGEVLLAHNAEVLRQPASIMKVLTTQAALDLLGPNYTWKTRAYVTGELRNGVLNGDLILVGGGDPYLTSERWWSFVGKLRQAGLKTINGDVVIDRSYFAPLNEDRAAFDNAPEKSYNVIPDALMVNFQTATFTLTGNVLEGRPELLIDPAVTTLQIDNEVRVVSGTCQRDYQNLGITTPQGPNGNELRIAGSMVAGCGSWSESRAIASAAQFAYGSFQSLFEQQGGSIKGGLRLATLPAQARLLVSFESLTLAEIVRLVNKFSNNVMARTLLLTLGAEQYGAPGSVEKGRLAINDWLMAQNMDATGFVVDNGAGLSRTERSTTKAMAAVLKRAWQDQFMPEFAASLPLSATDGTLRKRFNSPAMRGRLRMKTGSMEGVASLAGFVSAASGTNYVVVTMVNHPGAQNGKGFEVEAEVLRWVFGQ